MLSLLLSALRLLWWLAAVLESVRMRTFSTHGYQQIQVDTYFLRVALAEYVDDETLLDVVLDQVLAGTADRTLDPQHLDLSVSETFFA